MCRPILTYNRIDLEGNIIDTGTAKFYKDTYGISFQVLYESCKHGRIVGRSFRFEKGAMISQPEKRRSFGKEKTQGLIPQTTKEVYLFAGAYHELIYGCSGQLINTKFLRTA